MKSKNFRLRISGKQEQAILLKYPDIKFFLEKMIFDTAEKILEITKPGENSVEKYHERQALNSEAEWMPGQSYWKNRKHSKETKKKIKAGLKKYYERVGAHHLLPETKEKIRKSNIGKHSGSLSEEHKRKIGLAHRGMKYKKAKG